MPNRSRGPRYCHLDGSENCHWHPDKPGVGWGLHGVCGWVLLCRSCLLGAKAPCAECLRDAISMLEDS